jgi:hypothetical protein
MKKLLIAIAAVMITAASYGQGQVVFSNRVGADGIDAPVFIGSSTEGPGPSFSAQLYLVGANNALTPLTPVTTFQAAGTGSAAIKSRYVTAQTVDVPGVTPGTSANFQIRAWLTTLGSYDQAKASGTGYGESIVFAATPNVAPAAPGNLIGLGTTGFSIVNVPEPTVLALGVLGASALLLRRRK